MAALDGLRALEAYIINEQRTNALWYTAGAAVAFIHDIDTSVKIFFSVSAILNQYLYLRVAYPEETREFEANIQTGLSQVTCLFLHHT